MYSQSDLASVRFAPKTLDHKNLQQKLAQRLSAKEPPKFNGRRHNSSGNVESRSIFGREKEDTFPTVITEGNAELELSDSFERKYNAQIRTKNQENTVVYTEEEEIKVLDLDDNKGGS